MRERSVRNELVRSQIVVFALFLVASTAIVWQVQALAELPTRAVDENFRSIVDTEEMDRSLAVLVADVNDRDAQARFERALESQRNDVGEIGEREIVDQAQRQYDFFLTNPTPAEAQRLKEVVSQIFLLNEAALVRKNASASALAHRLALGILALSGLGFAAGMIAAARAAGLIARPLRELAVAVAAIGRRGPYPRLSESGYAESRTLAREFNALAIRLEEYERSNLDQILRQNAKLDAILASMSEGVILVDEERRIEMANHGALQTFGVASLDGILVDQAPGDPALRATIGRVADRPDHVAIEVPLLADGANRRISIVGAAVRDHVGTLIMLRDVTELRRAEADRGELMAKLTHELRTPLTSAAIAVSVLVDEPQASAQRRGQVLTLLLADLDRLKSLSDDIHQMARAQLAAAELVKESIMTESFLTSAASSFRLQAEQRAVALVVDCGVDLPPLHADRNRLPWVISNLCANALRHTPTGGTITLRARRADDSVLFEVIDTGPGIATEDQARLFEKFGQSRSSGPAGLAGLGLFIAREIVEAHGGFIGVESDPGAGSRFFFRLPASA